MTITVDNTGSPDKDNVSISLLKFNYNKESLNDWLNKTDNKYNVLVNDLPEMEKLTLTTFCYYQQFLSAETINSKIKQEYKSNVYKALESYKDNISKYIEAKISLENTFVDSIKDSEIVNNKCESLLSIRINMIKNCVEIGEETLNAVVDYYPITEEQDTVNDARVAVLSSLVNGIKLLANYYIQYVEYNGVTLFTNMPSDFKTIYSNVQNLHIKALTGMIYAESSSFNKDNVKSLLGEENLLADLKNTASQMEEIANKLDDKHYSINKYDDNYNLSLALLENVYNRILSRSFINSCLTNASNI